ncbi:7599_t:CDS:2 [Diversispora eburnea]|uniref:7599_t:CDS:1 n=1 Tax=Diversispora eburnea TaxID=1213867 RepID=A0A9N9A6K4_9GLOM|nr:7599_t:CDS:2 [Diversispora eburnea]
MMIFNFLRRTTTKSFRYISTSSSQQMIKNPKSSIAAAAVSSTGGEVRNFPKITMKKLYPHLSQYLLWTFFGSFTLHLLWSKMNYQEYQDMVNMKITKLEDIIGRLGNVKYMENVENAETVERDILAYKKFCNPITEMSDDDYVIKNYAFGTSFGTSFRNSKSTSDIQSSSESQSPKSPIKTKTSSNEQQIMKKSTSTEWI